MIMIGIDPHKATHTAVAVDDYEAVLAELTVRARRPRLTGSADGLTASTIDGGRSRPPTVSAISSPSSSSPPARRCSMCRRCWRPDPILGTGPGAEE